MMKEKKPATDKKIAKAKEYYALAQEHEKQREYMKAYQYYQKSLKLHEDKKTRKAYLKVLAIIGPM